MLEHDSLTVQQEVEHLEIFTGFETKNRYRILNPQGERLFFAYEESGGLSRQFLQTHRPLTINVVTEDRQPQIVGQRAFFWLFSGLKIADGQGNLIGGIKRRFAILKRLFDLYDANGQVLAIIEGPVLRPNTFRILQNGQEIARVVKKWSGLLREAASDADTFGIQFLQLGIPERLRWLILGSAFSIDLEFFEGKGRGASVSFGESR